MGTAAWKDMSREYDSRRRTRPRRRSCRARGAFRSRPERSPDGCRQLRDRGQYRRGPGSQDRARRQRDRHDALVHAASTAHLEIITTPQWFVVKVSDHGPGLTTEPLGELPAPGQERGRGLWLAEQLCDRVEVTSGTDGAHVSLYLRR
jgi:hypothetical protein